MDFCQSVVKYRCADSGHGWLLQNDIVYGGMGIVLVDVNRWVSSVMELDG